MAMPILDHQATAGAYDVQGLERCDALFANPVSSERGPWRAAFDGDALSTMDRAVLGMRFKEWKPVDKPVAAPDRAYCYLFDSNAAADIRDPFLGPLSCSRNDMSKLGPGREFVTNVFKDASPDHPHAGRFDYSKCIFEIDPARVTASNLAGFWKALSDGECDGYKQAAEASSAQFTQLIGQCNAALDSARRDEAAAREALSNTRAYWDQIVACREEQTQLQASLQSLAVQRSNLDCGFWGGRDFTRDCPGLSQSNDKQNLDAAAKSATAALAALEAEGKRLTRYVNDAAAVAATLQARSNAMAKQLDAAAKAAELCETETLPIARNRNATVTAQVQDAIKQLASRREALKEADAAVAQLTARVNALAARQIDLERQKTALQTEFIACKADTERNQALSKQNREDAMRYQRMQQECDSDLQLKTRRLEQLRQTQASLTRERDDWLARCRQDQQRFYAETNARIVNEARVIEDKGRQVCGAVDPIASEVKQLLDEKQQAMQALENARQSNVQIDAAWCKNPANKAIWDQCCLPVDANVPMPLQPE